MSEDDDTHQKSESVLGRIMKSHVQAQKIKWEKIHEKHKVLSYSTPRTKRIPPAERKVVSASDLLGLSLKKPPSALTGAEKTKSLEADFLSPDENRKPGSSEGTVTANSNQDFAETKILETSPALPRLQRSGSLWRSSRKGRPPSAVSLKDHETQVVPGPSAGQSNAPRRTKKRKRPKFSTLFIDPSSSEDDLSGHSDSAETSIDVGDLNAAKPVHHAQMDDEANRGLSDIPEAPSNNGTVPTAFVADSMLTIGNDEFTKILKDKLTPRKGSSTELKRKSSTLESSSSKVSSLQLSRASTLVLGSSSGSGASETEVESGDESETETRTDGTDGVSEKKQENLSKNRSNTEHAATKNSTRQRRRGYSRKTGALKEKQWDSCKVNKPSSLSSRGSSSEQVVQHAESDGAKSSTEEEDAALFEEQYPFFANPHFEGPNKPLLLQKGHAVPSSINRYLQEYQQHGVRWLHSCYTAGKGAILADEMGLGKTIQVISLISAILGKTGKYQDKVTLQTFRRRASLRRDNPDYLEEKQELRRGVPILIVSPASVVTQWLKEIAKWGHFDARQLKGSFEEREYVLRSAEKGRLELVVGSYDMLRSHGEVLGSINWHAVFFDECHLLKNPKSSASKIANGLSTKLKFGMTGTPMSNNYDELWALVNLVQPDLLGPLKKFKEHFSVPIKRAHKRSAKGEILAIGREREKQLKYLLRKVMLKRDKSVIEDQLMGKEIKVVLCPLSPFQYQLYEKVLSLPEFQLLIRGKEGCDCGRGSLLSRAKCCYSIPMKEGVVDPRAVLWKRLHPDEVACEKCPYCIQLLCITKLQKIANHPALLQVDLRKHSHQKQQEYRDFAAGAIGAETMAKIGGVERSQQFLEQCRTDVCGKMLSLEGLLEKYRRQNGRLPQSNKNKVLIFSWSTQTLDVIQAFTTSKGYSHIRLDGSTSQGNRQTLIDKFNTDSSVFLFLVSTRAGGMGLNLASANRVIIFDVNWNPSYDLQAQDRAFRLGQKRFVTIHLLISEGCIEEIAYMRQLYKLRLGESVLTKNKLGKREFEAVQGEKNEDDELFGLTNLMTLQPTSILNGLRQKYSTMIAEEEMSENEAKAAFADVEEIDDDIYEESQNQLQRIFEASVVSEMTKKEKTAKSEDHVLLKIIGVQQDKAEDQSKVAEEKAISSSMTPNVKIISTKSAECSATQHFEESSMTENIGKNNFKDDKGAEEMKIENHRYLAQGNKHKHANLQEVIHGLRTGNNGIKQCAKVTIIDTSQNQELSSSNLALENTKSSAEQHKVTKQPGGAINQEHNQIQSLKSKRRNISHLKQSYRPLQLTKQANKKNLVNTNPIFSGPINIGQEKVTKTDGFASNDHVVPSDMSGLQKCSKNDENKTKKESIDNAFLLYTPKYLSK